MARIVKTRVMARRVAPSVVDGFCRVAGRRAVVRAARFVLNRARLDLPNNIQRNGEADLQRWFLTAVGSGEVVTLDVGANVGKWSRAMLDHQRAHAPTVRIALHAFEPASHTCELLRAALPSTVRINQLAASDRNGMSVLQVVRPGAGTNSLHGPGHRRTAEGTESVATKTLDDYCAEHQLPGIDFLKIDTEGHDLAVLHGAIGLLRTQSIRLCQFEYNHRWVHARRFLKDVFDLVEPNGYRVGKVTPRGIEFYRGWSPELETFIESNYVICEPDLASLLPQVTWWNEPRVTGIAGVGRCHTPREGDNPCTSA